MAKTTLELLLQGGKELFDIALFIHIEATFWYNRRILLFTKRVFTNFKCHS